MKERECKIMQVNLKIYPEDETTENLMGLILDIMNASSDRVICVDNVILDNKEILSKRGFSI